VTTSSITPKIHKPLDVHGDFTPPITFNNKVVFNNCPDPVDIIRTQIIAIHLIGQVGFV
jgi:hypothetical protein